jgi:pimeloyl-ACP methyl ester carboxylesterase
MMKPLIVALALLFAGHAWAGAGDLRLEPCKDPKLKQPSKCGTYTVWENREAKSGRTIDLNIVVLGATGKDRKPDPVFILLGGPGEGAASDGPEWSADDPLRMTRDVVFVDARGTGKSNGLHCLIPKDGPLQDFMPTLNVEVIKACRTELEKHADLRYYLTTYAMDDLDDVRAALGYEKINLDGGSYGTGAVLVYIRQHGEHVRSATLWSATALTQPMPQYFAKDAEVAIHNVFNDCYAEAACKAAFPALEGDYRRAVAKVESGPVRLTVKDPRNEKPAQVSLDAEAFAESLRAMLYSPKQCAAFHCCCTRQLAATIRHSQNSSSSATSGSTLQSQTACTSPFTCTEDVDRTDPDQLRENNRGTFLSDHRSRPHIEGCKGWPRGKLPPGFGDEVKSDVPVLIVNGGNDPATPPGAGKAAMSRLTNARLNRRALWRPLAGGPDRRGVREEHRFALS